jgi:hypothetical protein
MVLHEHVRSLLNSHVNTISGSYDDFENQLRRAQAIYDGLPPERIYRIAIDMKPWDYGKDIRESVIGLLEEQIEYLDLINITYGHKLFELSLGIADGLNLQRFRIAVVSCRTLYEEAAAATHHWLKVRERIREVVAVPPSAFRLKRLEKLTKEEVVARIKTILNANSLLRKWHHMSKIDVQKPDDHKLPKTHALFPDFFLSSFKTTVWEGRKPAPFFYALLCAVTHPNVGAATLYADEVIRTPSQLRYIIRKGNRSEESYGVIFDMICRPTIECVKALDTHISEMRQEKGKLEQYIRRVRRLP